MKPTRTATQHYLLISIAVLLFLLTTQGMLDTAGGEDGRTGDNFSDLLHDARDSLAEFEFNRLKGCGTQDAIRLVHTLFSSRAKLLVGDTTDPDKPRKWSSKTGTPTTINLRWTRFSDQTSAGKIFFEGIILDSCDGKPPGTLKEAYVRFTIPVNGSGGNFSAGTPREVKVETVCCGSNKRHNYVYDLKGFPLRVVGTDYPPTAATPPKPEPRRGSDVRSGSGGTAPQTLTGTGSGAVSGAVTGAAAGPEHSDKPEIFDMEQVCELCEGPKALADHLKDRLQSFETEKDQVDQELRNRQSRQTQLAEDMEALEDELTAQREVGGESTDPATGLTTKSYDDGSGNVVVTRHYPDGRVEEINRYPRRSTQDTQQDIDAKRMEKARLTREASQLENRSQQLDTAINETKNRLLVALNALAVCIDRCNQNIGYQTNYRKQYPEPSGGAAAAAGTSVAGTDLGQGSTTEPGPQAKSEPTQGGGSNITSSDQGTKGTDTQGSKTSAGTAGAAAGAAGAQQDRKAPQTDQAAPKLLQQSELTWGYQTNAKWQFHKTWSFKTEMKPELGVEDSQKNAKSKFDRNRYGSLTDIMGIEGGFGDYSFVAKPLYRIFTDNRLAQQDQQTSRRPFRLPTAEDFASQPALSGDPIASGAFGIIFGGGSNFEIGGFIGSSVVLMPHIFKGAPFAPSPSFMMNLADYTLNILEAYSMRSWGDESFSPENAGDIVYAAVIAAGGSREEAHNQARRGSTIWKMGATPLRTRLDYPEYSSMDSDQWQIGDRLTLGPNISGFAVDPNAFSRTKIDFKPWILNVLFMESNRVFRYYDTVAPDDPLYKKSEGFASAVGSVLKKGVGLLLGGGDSGGSEPQAEDQWGLHAVGFTPKGNGSSAWDTYDGMQKNIVVAVIDSGLDLVHPDRPKYIWKNSKEIPNNDKDDDGNGYVDDIHGWNFVSENNDVTDDYGHGTFVAGIIAANTNNAEGIAGINPGAQIMVLKVSNRDVTPRDLAVYRALRYAVDNGAWVINISLGNRGKSRLVQIGLNYAHAMGRIVVVAAGNEGADIAEFTPQSSRRVISVGSTDMDGSARGSSNKGLSLALVAPGQSIYSLTATKGKRDGQITPMTGGKYHRLNGTSFAAPFVTGTASLLWAKNPSLTNTEVEDKLLATASQTEASGWTPQTGMGQLSARSAMAGTGNNAFAPRIREVYVNKKRKKVHSVDVYGIIRGPEQSYSLEVAQGKDPDADEWQQVLGPSKKHIDLGHIARIPGTYFAKGSKWSIRLVVNGPNETKRVQQVLVNMKK